MVVKYESQEFLSRSLRESFNNYDFSDVTISLKNGAQFFCHKFVLSMGSSVFRKMFTSDMKERSAPVVPLEGQPDAVESVLRFLYTGQCELSDENIVSVSATADYFDVQELQHFCQHYIKTYLAVNRGNCIDLLTNGLEQKVDEVFAVAAEYFIEIVSDSGDVQSLSYPLIEGLVKQARHFKGSQMKVLSMINRWIEGNGPEVASQGIDLCLEVNLNTLSLDELSDICCFPTVLRAPRLQLAVVKAMSHKSVDRRAASHSRGIQETLRESAQQTDLYKGTDATPASKPQDPHLRIASSRFLRGRARGFISSNMRKR